MQNFKKILLKSIPTIFFSICIIMTTLAHATSVDHTLTDEAIVNYAGRLNVSSHVVKLEVDIPLIFATKTVFSASAVCIGDGEFITNAHCIKLWCNSKWQLIYPLFVENNGEREQVVGIRIHDMYTESTKNKSHDIAYLRTRRNPAGIMGIEPTYRTPESILGQTLTLIGFGASGGFRDYFGCNDGRKRAVTCPINSFHISAQVPDQKFFLAASTIGSEFDYSNSQQPTIKIKPLLEYQAGIRPGMSGGGAFLGEEYVGIPSRFGLGTNFSLAKKLKLKAEKKLKYLAALRIPMPLMHNYLGDKESVIMLGVHEEWIRQSRAADITGQYIAPTPMSHYVKCAATYAIAGLMFYTTLKYFTG